jgi:hypothetical protein
MPRLLLPPAIAGPFGAVPPYRSAPPLPDAADADESPTHGLD